MLQWCEIGRFQHSYTLVKVEEGAWGLFSPPHSQLAAGGRKHGLKDSLAALSEGEVPVPIHRFTNQMFHGLDLVFGIVPNVQRVHFSPTLSKHASDKLGKLGLCANVFAFLIEDRETTMHSLDVEGSFTQICNQSTGRLLLVWAGVWKVITGVCFGVHQGWEFQLLANTQKCRPAVKPFHLAETRCNTPTLERLVSVKT